MHSSGDSTGVAASPPQIAPGEWEDHPVLRKTFLVYVSEPQFGAALRTAERHLYEMVLNFYQHWPEWPESATATLAASGLADLRHLQGFFDSLGREHLENSLSSRDIRLSLLAAEIARELATLGDRIEAALGVQE